MGIVALVGVGRRPVVEIGRVVCAGAGGGVGELARTVPVAVTLPVAVGAVPVPARGKVGEGGVASLLAVGMAGAAAPGSAPEGERAGGLMVLGAWA